MNARARRLRAAGPWILDGLLAVAAASAGAHAGHGAPSRAGLLEGHPAYALVLGHTLPIAVRRRFPLPALAWGWPPGWPSPRSSST